MFALGAHLRKEFVSWHHFIKKKKGIYGNSSSFLLPPFLVFQQQQHRCLFFLFHQPGMPEAPWSLQKTQCVPNSAQRWCSWCQKPTFSPSYHKCPLFVTALMRHGSALPSLSVQLHSMLPSIHTFFNKTGSIYTKWQQLLKSISKHVLSHTNYMASEANIFSAMLTHPKAESKTLPCKNPHSAALQLKAALYKNTPKTHYT